MLTINAPAKVNWYLEVPGKRADGFHELVSVMQTINLCDQLVLRDSSDGRIALDCNINLGPIESNLVYRAARLLQQLQGRERGALIALHKRIPHGAGLGGGSSDAAATLVALDRLWGLHLGADRLREIAAEIGSDCAFFIEGGTALCTGRGEIVQQLPDQPPIPLVVLYPDEVCPTAAVYKDLANRSDYGPPRADLEREFAIPITPMRLRDLVFNRLEASSLKTSKKLEKVWRTTNNEPGSIVRFVSGSGSSVVFVAESELASCSLADSLRSRQLGQSFATVSLPKGALWE